MEEMEMKLVLITVAVITLEVVQGNQEVVKQLQVKLEHTNIIQVVEC